MLDRSDEQPISIGGVGEFGALGGIGGASSAKQCANGSAARALGGARRAHAPFGAGLLVAVCVLRGSLADERRLCRATSDGCAGVSAIPRGVRTGRSW